MLNSDQSKQFQSFSQSALHPMLAFVRVGFVTNAILVLH